MSYAEHLLDENNCEICAQGGEEDKILLCDKCDSEFHMFCLRPKLCKVPEGEWLCPLCCTDGATIYLEKSIENNRLKVLHSSSSSHQSQVSQHNDDEIYSEFSLMPTGFGYVGCLIRLFSPCDMCYHSGRIIAQRFHNDTVGEHLEHLVQFQK